MSASGLLTALRFVKESALGIPDGTAYSAVRFTDTSLNVKKATFESAEIRSDRQLADLRHGMQSVDGDFGFELGLKTFDDLIAAVMSGDWEAVTTGSMSLGATTGTNTITRAAGSFIDDGFTVGDEVLIAGFVPAGNNGTTKVLSVAANGLSMVVAKALTTAAPAAGVTVSLTGEKVKAGTVLSTFSMERAFLDINQYLLFKGCAIDQLKLSIKPDQMVTASMTVVGTGDYDIDGATHAVTIVPAAANSPMDTFNGGLLEGGTAIASVLSVDLTMENGRMAKNVVGSNVAVEIFEGMFKVTGTMACFFKDGTLLQKFLGETNSSLNLKIADPNGVDFHNITLPNIKYTGATLDNPKDGPVTLTLPFSAIYDPVSGTSAVYQKSNT